MQSSCEMVRSTSTGKDVSSTLLGSAPLLGCASRLEHAGYLSGSPAHKGEREVQGKMQQLHMRQCTSGLVWRYAHVAGTSHHGRRRQAASTQAGLT